MQNNKTRPPSVTIYNQSFRMDKRSKCGTQNVEAVRGNKQKSHQNMAMERNLKIRSPKVQKIKRKSRQMGFPPTKELLNTNGENQHRGQRTYSDGESQHIGEKTHSDGESQH